MSCLRKIRLYFLTVFLEWDTVKIKKICYLRILKVYRLNPMLLLFILKFMVLLDLYLKGLTITKMPATTLNFSKRYCLSVAGKKSGAATKIINSYLSRGNKTKVCSKPETRFRQILFVKFVDHLKARDNTLFSLSFSLQNKWQYLK